MTAAAADGGSEAAQAAWLLTADAVRIENANLSGGFLTTGTITANASAGLTLQPGAGGFRF